MSRPAVSVERLTAAEAQDRSRRVAGALVERGVAAGERVVFALGSSAELICAVLGAARSGVVPVLLNATLLEAERDRLASDADPSLCVFDDATLHQLGQGDPVDIAPVPLVRPVHYTSGTTGRSKGVFTGIWDEATAQRVLDDEADLWSFDADDSHLLCSPMYHTVAVRFATSTLMRGGTLYILSRFDAHVALEALRRDEPTTTFMVPTHLKRVLDHPELGADEVFSSLRLLAHAGAPCPPSLKRAAFDRVRPGSLYEFYGSTEGQFTVCPPELWLEHPGTVGRARPGRKLHIEGPEGADGIGTIWCQVPEFARFSYWNDPVATAAAWQGDAFTVGDIGHLEGDLLFLSGRRQDLIITGGVNVYPAEIEAVLSELVTAEVAVFGVDDEDWGQRVCAAVVGDVDLDALAAAAAQRLAPYKRPKTYIRADDLPHTATGKLIRHEVAGHLGLVPPAS